MRIDAPSITGSFTLGTTTLPDGGALATTGSNTFSGNQIINGTIVVTGTTLVSSSVQILSGTTIHSGSFFNGISVISGSAQVDVMSTTNIARLATTGSNTLQGTQTINGSLVVTGSLTAQQFIVSSSVTYLTTSFASGSTKFGDTSDDTHQFTGSVYMSASLTTGGDININSNGIFIDRQSSGEPYIFFKKSGVIRASIYGGNGAEGLRFFSAQNDFSGSMTVTGSLTTSGAVAIGSINDGAGTLYVTASANTNAARLRNNNASYGTLDILNSNASGIGIYAVANKHYLSGSIGINETAPSKIFTINIGGNINDGLLVTGSNRQETRFKSHGEHSNVFIDSGHSNIYLPTLALLRSGTSFGEVKLQRASNSDSLGAYTESEMVIGSTTTVPVSIKTNEVRRIVIASGGSVNVYSSLTVSSNMYARNFNNYVRSWSSNGSYVWHEQLDAIAGVFDDGGLYKGFIKEANNAHYYGYTFDINVGSKGYGGTSLQYVVRNMTAAHGAWTGGCGTNSFASIDNSGFTKQSSACFDTLNLYITKIGG